MRWWLLLVAGVGCEGVPGAGLDALPSGTWSYVPIEGMVCGNGAPTGVGVNPGPDPTQLVLVLQGGGACWDALTCFGLEAATYVEEGWGAEALASEVGLLEDSTLFAREGAVFSEATWVLVPYCTGDLHAGDEVQAYSLPDGERALHHRGARNLNALLAWLGEASERERVWAVGFSAGGYGVQLMADQLVRAFPGAEHALLADGAPMIHPRGSLWGVWRAAWSLALPEGCVACETSAPETLEVTLDALDPEVRVGLVTTRSDDVISAYLGFGLTPIDAEVDALIEEVYAPRPRVNAFVADGGDHVLLGDLDRRAVDGTRLGDWVEAWQEDDPSWSDTPLPP